METDLQLDLDIIKESCERVYNYLDYGLSERSYQKALLYELQEQFDNVVEEYHIGIEYITSKGRIIQVADNRIDIIIDNKYILELKTLDSSLDKKKEITITKEYKQLTRYLKNKNMKYGMLVNFGKTKLDFIKIFI